MGDAERITGTNYFIQAQNGEKVMEECVEQTIASLRREAADEGHCQEFIDQCATMANQLESGDREL